MKFLIQHYLKDSFAARRGNTAIEQGDRRFTYGELDALSLKFAARLSAMGLGKGDRIGIFSRVRAETVAALIACLRLGITYVPLNIHAPTAWLGNIVRKAGLEVLLADPKFLGAAAELRPFGVASVLVAGEEAPLNLDKFYTQFKDILASEAPRPEEPAILADDLAYILYTSGSTGDPKGIMITHRNAATFIEWMREEFKLGENDRVFNRAPLQFDLSVFDIYSTLAAGATLVLPGTDFEATPENVVSLMIEKRATVVYTVPSAYIGMLTKGGLDRGVPSLRLALYAGEPFAPPFLRRVMACLPQTTFCNIYGPTETNIVTYYYIPGPPRTDDPIPIGKPVLDTEAYIVDENMKRVKDGEIGEIVIRGGTCFAGYFNDRELTAKKLVQSPFHDYPTLCCRTGDYGRLLPDGNIEYRGRMDNMVKTRGYRVELGEVETAIAAHPGVQEVGVVPRPHEKYGNALYAFVVLKTGAGADALKKSLEGSLPSYMIPFAIVALDNMPKTATGKVDRVTLTRRALAAPA